MKENTNLTRYPWFIPAVVLILVFAMAARTPLDSDMWWHLRAGQATWEAGKPLTIDIFSYTRHGEDWANHSWLAQVSMYLIYKCIGTIGLGATVAFLATLSLAFVYFQMEGSPLLRAFILIFTAAVAAPVWSPRPQLASLVLFGLVGFLLYRYKWRKRDQLWILVPVFMLWSNLHGGYVLGLLLIAGVIVGEMLNHALGFTGPEVISRKGAFRLLAWGVAAGLVVVINPNGINIWVIPFKTVGVSVLRQLISEWLSPDFHQFAQQTMVWLLLATLGAAGLTKRRLDGSDLVCVAGFAYMAFLARRNFGPFAMVAAPVLSRHLSMVWMDLWSSFKNHIGKDMGTNWAGWLKGKTWSNSKGILALNIAILALLLAIAMVKLSIVSSPTFVAKANQQLYPVQAVGWVEDNQPTGQMFNSYNWGGYLLWTLPDYPVFVDGRTDLYDEELLRDYALMAAGEAGWQKLFDRNQVNFVLMEANSDLIEQLARAPGWTKVYGDELAVVYLRKY